MTRRDIPFRAALFDLDGTLLDSMYVWKEVDVRFFADLNMEMPEDYPRSIAGMSFRETAEYTKKRFGLKDSWQEIADTWTRMSREEYHQRVQLKKGSAEYLRFLKSKGVRLAVTTTLIPELYEECLRRNGIYDMFDAFCSTREKSKADGEIFRRAASMLGVAAEDCAVFEDVYEGIVGAKAAGMRAYCVDDHAARHSHAMSAQLADAMLDNILDMRKVHDMDGRCVVFTAVCARPDLAYVPREGDYVLCADAGYKIALDMGVRPDLVMGDFDSSDVPGGLSVQRHPVEKDDTDTMLCLRTALEKGYREILIVGGLGGRFDHSIANVQAMLFAAKAGADAVLDDGRTRMCVIVNGSAELRRQRDTVSVFAMGGQATGVTLRGLQYPLTDANIGNDFPIGCSNHFAEDTAVVSVRNGALLVVEEYEHGN